MQIVLAILSVGLLGLIIYFAASPKSSRLLKITAFGALGLIGLSLVVCGIFLIKGPSESPELIPLPVFQEAQPPAKSSNTLATVVVFLVFLIVMTMIIFLALRQQKKKGTKTTEDAEKSPVFSAADELEFEESDKKEEDSFDIEIP